VSVGHLARAFEVAGMATVAVFIGAFRHVAEHMKVPRTVITRHPMGRPLGAPGDGVRQRQAALAALRLLEEAHGGSSIIELPERYHVPQVHDGFP
jgi:hypothetical protein